MHDNVNSRTTTDADGPIIDDMGLTGHDSKLFKRRFRLDVRKFVFSNRVINSWNSLPTQCVNCNTVDTFKKYVSIALESETDVNS